MTPLKERDYLYRHGTKIAALKPANIVQAAAADLRLRARKRVGAKARRA